MYKKATKTVNMFLVLGLFGVLVSGLTLANTVTIGFWGYIGAGDESIRRMQDVVAAFEAAHPDIQVEHDPSQLHIIAQRIVPAYLGGAEPDVWFVDRGGVAPLAARGMIQPLDKFLETDRDLSRDSFFPGTLEAATYKGQLYGIPNMVEVWALHRNKAYLDEAGIDPDSPPTTLEEMAPLVKKLTVYDGNGLLQRAGYLHMPQFPNQGAYGLIRQLGATYFSEDGRRAQIASDQAIEAVRWLQEFTAPYGDFETIDGIWGDWGIGVLDMFHQGRLAFWAGWHWEEGNWDLWELRDNLDYGISPILSPEGTDPLNIAGGWAYVMSSQSANPEAAWEFIKFSMGETAQQILAGELPSGKEYLVLSANRNYEMTQIPEKLARFPNLQVALDQANQNLTYKEPHPLFEDVHASFRTTAMSILREEVGIVTGLQELQRTVQAQLDEYWEQQD